MPIVSDDFCVSPPYLQQFCKQLRGPGTTVEEVCLTMLSEFKSKKFEAAFSTE